MLDVHPPHHAVDTWRDFFIHIATIVIGLCIAVGLEQTVEAIHHHRQRTELTEQMRAEAEHNLPIIRESIDRLQRQALYLQSLHAALYSGKVSGTGIDVAGVVPTGGSVIFLTPSRGTWVTAQAAGLVALLPPEEAKMYARIDFNAEQEVQSESALYEKLRLLASECARVGYDHATTGVSHLTAAHRDDLLFQVDQVESAIESFIRRLGLLEGGDEAVAAGVNSLDDLYPYQNAALGKLHFNSALGGFYGGQPGMTYVKPADREGSIEQK